MTESVFAAVSTDLFATYDVSLKFRSRLLGGIPKDPKVIEGWIRAKAGVNEQAEVRQMLFRTLEELGADVTPDMELNELEEASAKLAADKHTNGFKQNASGLYLEDRNIKAGIKESVNILFAGERWGTTRKGPRNFTAERVFLGPEQISLGRTEPDGIQMTISHISGPTGTRSALTYFEYVEEAELSFRVMSLKDEVEADNWPMIWAHLQENGLGAARSQGFGRFDVTRWEKVN